MEGVLEHHDARNVHACNHSGLRGDEAGAGETGTVQEWHSAQHMLHTLKWRGVLIDHKTARLDWLPCVGFVTGSDGQDFNSNFHLLLSHL